MTAAPSASPGEVRSGTTRSPAVVGRTIFDYADDLAIQMPASCQRSGRCHECIVEVSEGADALGAPTEPESFLLRPYRLACQARIERLDSAIEFRPLRRRLRVMLGQEDAPVTWPLAPRRSTRRSSAPTAA